VLRPSEGSILGSSRAARRRTLRRERMRAVGHTARMAGVLASGLSSGLLGFVLPIALPILYLGSAFLLPALPLRWFTGRAAVTPFAVSEWLFAGFICAIGIFRFQKRAEPLAPVRPAFAQWLFLSAGATGLFLALADLVR
jgi:hypothetical protein